MAYPFLVRPNIIYMDRC